jgi:multidrug resistance protein, MATE family
VTVVVFVLRESLIAQFTRDQEVAALALGLLGLGLLFHFFDAIQGIAAFVLRGYKVAFLPMLIHSVALWAIGLAGGYWLAYHPPGGWPLGPAESFWLAGAVGLVVAAFGLSWLASFVARSRAQEDG